MTIFLANWLSEQGEKVDLLVFENVGEFKQKPLSNVNVVVLGGDRARKALPGLIFYLWNAKPWILYTAMNHVNLLGLIGKLASPFRLRVVISERVHLSSALKTQTSKMRRISGLLTVILYRFAEGIVAVSQEVADDLRINWVTNRSTIHVVYNPTVTREMEAQASEPTNHKWFHVDKTKEKIPVIVTAGRLSVQKDFPTLFHAMSRISKTRQIRCIILGEGEERPALVNLVADLGLSEFVDFAGFLDNPFAFFSKSDCFVLASKLEGLPNVAIEALASGAHVVATDVPGGLSEIFSDGKMGHLVPAGDPSALARAIIDAIDGKCEHDVRWALANFSYETQLQRYYDILVKSSLASR